VEPSQHDGVSMRSYFSGQNHTSTESQ
jgi:hypothetical protein